MNNINPKAIICYHIVMYSIMITSAVASNYDTIIVIYN